MAFFWSRLCSFGRRVLIHCGGGSKGKGLDQVSALFLWSAWSQSLRWRLDRQGRWSGHASVLLVGVGSVTKVVSRQAKALFCSRLCIFGRLGFIHSGDGPIGKDVGLVSPLFLWSAWAQTMWWLADRQGRWSGLASVPLVGVGSVSVVADN
jgi:hypothetical protein